MIPRRSFLGRFTRRGRLVNRWAAALAEPDPARSLRLLLDVATEFGNHPARSAALWTPFLGTVLSGYPAPLLTTAHLNVLEAAAASVATGSAGGLSLDEAWYPLISTRDTRREYDAANVLMTRLYWSEDLAGPRKAAIARELARRGASTAEYQAIYVDHLAHGAHPAGEPRMVAVLARCLTVGFGEDTDRLERAGELAGKLRAAGVTIPGVDLALGYRALLVERDPGGAAPHLLAAHTANRADRTALVGLLSAWVRTGEHDRVLSLARASGPRTPRVVNELALLSATLCWLEDSTVHGPVPATSGQLATLPVATYAGEWLDYAVGRLHLLEGDAARAAAVLVPLADQHPEQPRWNYHAAWALLLRGDWLGVAQRFLAARNWPGRWTIGCLLVEANPNVVDTVAGELGESGLPPTRARIVEARLSLTRRGRPRPVGVLDTGDGILEERLESLRTALGTYVSKRDFDAMTAAIGEPLFSRLPLADQLLWSGLALPPKPGRRLLERAADEFGYPRAALVLAVRGFGDGIAGTNRVARLAWRSDPTMELVRAWAEVLAGEEKVPAARLETLADQGEPGAHFALGQLWLVRAGTGEAGRTPLVLAAKEFRAALEHSAPGIVTDTRILSDCTELAVDREVSTADCAAHWAEIRDRSTSLWVSWTVALAALVDDPATVDLRACECLVTILDEAEAPPPAAVIAVAFGLTRACLLCADPDRAGALAAMLGRLAGRATRPEVTRLYELSVAGAARHRPTRREPAFAGAPVALVMAERSLGEGDRAAAAGHLRGVPPDDNLESRFCRLAADLVQDSPIRTEDSPPEPTSVTAEALLVLEAAAVVKDNPERGLDLLTPVIQERDLTGIVDLRDALPRLCARTARGQVPGYLSRIVRDAKTTGDGAMDPLVLARCCVAIGERQRAMALWRDALAERPEARKEYAAALCHEAVLARRQGEDLLAAGCLLLAARVLAGGQLPLSQHELAALPKRFRQETRDLGIKRQNTLTNRWAVIERAFTMAVAVDDEPRALLCLTLLENLTKSGPPTRTGLPGMAMSIVSGLCLARLLAHLFPNDGEVRESPGRHRVLEDVIEHNPDLLFALLDDDRNAVGPAWRDCLTGNGLRVRFQHALAVLYRERALAGTDHDSTVDNLVIATMLWVLLLSTGRFWKHLGEPVEETRLAEAVARELLTANETRGRQALAAGKHEVAGRYLRCIADCREDSATLVRRLGTFHLPYRHTVDENRFERVSAIAKEVMWNWVSDVVRVAEEAVADKEAIASLPSGVSRNYEGGIKHLRPFLRLKVPVPQVLRTGLEWYNEWRLDLLTTQNFDRVRQLTESAAVFADALAPLCVKRRGLQSENQVLSEHFWCAGIACADLTEKIRYYEESIAWNPENGLARKRLASARAMGAVDDLLEKEKPFVEAMTEIGGLVRLRVQVPGSLGPKPSEKSTKSCAVCGETGSSARLAVIESIVRTVRATGEFRADGIAAFWSPFGDQLCGSCGTDLKSIAGLRTRGVRLLEQAVELDDQNESLKENLEKLRQRS